METNTFLKLKILTPSKKVYDENVLSVSFNEFKGNMTILKNHAPTIGKVFEGLIKITNIDNKKETFSVNDGLFIISDNILKITTSYCQKINS